MTEEQDRRAHHRYELFAQVQVTRESEVHILSTLNISHGGIFLQADPKELTDLRHGVDVELHLFDADDFALGFSVKGRVVRVVPSHLPGQAAGFGVRFVDIPPAGAKQLREILANLDDSAWSEAPSEEQG